MKFLARVLFLVSLVFLLASFFAFFYFSNSPTTMILPARVSITQESIGFDLNDSALTFGNVISGGSGVRTVLVHNSHEYPLYGQIISNGSITSVLSYDPSFVVPPGEAVRVPFTVTTLEAEPGEYEGFVTILLK